MFYITFVVICTRPEPSSNANIICGSNKSPDHGLGQGEATEPGPDPCRVYTGTKCHTKHLSLSVVKSVLLLHHIKCSSKCTFTNMGQLILQATAHASRHQHVTNILAYFDYMRANIIYTRS
jgi:hypothetical protein